MATVRDLVNPSISSFECISKAEDDFFKSSDATEKFCGASGESFDESWFKQYRQVDVIAK
jgi:hypothetical protein